MKKLMGFMLIYAFVLCLGGCSKEATSIGIIGGADGPTAVFVTSAINWVHIFGAVGAIAIAVLAVLIIRHNKKK